MSAIKGKPSWNKGRKETRPEVLMKQSLSHVGQKAWSKGKKLSKEHCERLSESHKGYVMPLEQRKKIGVANIGKTLSEEARKKISKATLGVARPHMRGANCSAWKGGITTVNHQVRTSLEMILWRKACMERDNFTCQKTGIKGGDLEVHHINNFADFTELRTSISNGITLSKKAHTEFHKKYGYKNNTREQLEEWLKLSSLPSPVTPAVQSPMQPQMTPPVPTAGA